MKRQMASMKSNGRILRAYPLAIQWICFWPFEFSPDYLASGHVIPGHIRYYGAGF